MAGSLDFHSERLTMSPITVAAANFMLKLTNSEQWVEFIGNRGLKTTEDAASYIENGSNKSFAEHGFGSWLMTLRDTDTAIGICGFFQRPNLKHPDLGFALLPQYFRRGYAHEACQATLAFGREVLGIKRVLAIVSPANEASIGLLEKLGMVRERVEEMESGDVVHVFGFPDEAAADSVTSPSSLSNQESLENKDRVPQESGSGESPRPSPSPLRLVVKRKSLISISPLSRGRRGSGTGAEGASRSPRTRRRSSAKQSLNMGSPVTRRKSQAKAQSDVQRQDDDGTSTKPGSKQRQPSGVGQYGILLGLVFGVLAVLVYFLIMAMSSPGTRPLQSCDIYLAIVSPPGNTINRDAMRQSWLKRLPSTVQYKFFVPHPKAWEELLQGEQNRAGDIELVDDNVIQEVGSITLYLLHHILSRYELQFLGKLDDNVLVIPEHLSARLSQLDPAKQIYLGSSMWHAQASDQDVKRHDWALQELPAYNEGLAYFLSKGVLSFLRASLQQLKPVEGSGADLEEVSLALWLLAIQVHPIHDPGVVVRATWKKFHSAKFCKNDSLVAFGPLTPTELRQANVAVTTGTDMCQHFQQQQFTSELKV